MMRSRGVASLVVVALLGSGAQVFAQSPEKEKSAGTPAPFDACKLIRKKEIESLQGSPINDAKSSERADGDFRVSQCFYTAAEFSRSVTLTVFQKHPTDPGKRDPVEFWKHTFARHENEEAGEKEGEKEEPREREEEGAPPRKMSRLGDEAFWVPNRFGGTLYVLKGDAFFSISIGGTDPEQTKIDKSKKLAAKALQRLK
jgi:hypothetical protein